MESTNQTITEIVNLTNDNNSQIAENINESQDKSCKNIDSGFIHFNESQLEETRIEPKKSQCI